FVLAVFPQQLTGRGVERNHGAPRSGRSIENALDHQRRPFEIGFGRGAEVVGLEPPSHLQFGKVARVDLAERRVASAAGIAAVAWPLSILRSGLRPRGRCRHGKHAQREHRAGGQRAHSLHVILPAWSRTAWPPVCLGGLYCCSRKNAPVQRVRGLFRDPDVYRPVWCNPEEEFALISFSWKPAIASSSSSSINP